MQIRFFFKLNSIFEAFCGHSFISNFGAALQYLIILLAKVLAPIDKKRGREYKKKNVNTGSKTTIKSRIQNKYIQRVPALRGFWDLEKTVLHEIRVSGTVLWSPTNANSPTYTYISQKSC